MTALDALLLAQNLGLLSSGVAAGSALIAVLAVFQIAKLAKRAEVAAIQAELAMTRARHYAEETNEMVADHEINQILFGTPPTKGEETPF